MTIKKAIEMYLDLIEERDSLKTVAGGLEVSNQVLRIEITELKKTLEFAAQYRGIEGHSCPLCRYENGVFIENCQMHKDLEAQHYQIIGMQTEIDRITQAHTGLILELQQIKRNK